MAAPAGPRPAAAQAYLALAFLSLFWGYAWVAVKVATRDASAIWVAALRSSLGAAALLAFLALTGRSLRPPPFPSTFLFGLLQTAGFTLLQTVAVARGGAGRTAILAYTMPFWLALLAWPLLGERIAGLRWAALGLAGAGLWLIVDPASAPPGALLPSLLAVAAGLVWAAAAVLAVRLRQAGADLLSLNAWQMAWGSLLLLGAAWAWPGRVDPTPSFLAAIAFLAVAATALGWALWLFVLSRLPAATAGLASLATPVVGIALAAALLGELPGGRELAGMAAIAAALGVDAWARARAG